MRTHIFCNVPRATRTRIYTHTYTQKLTLAHSLSIFASLLILLLFKLIILVAIVCDERRGSVCLPAILLFSLLTVHTSALDFVLLSSK